MIFEDIKNKTSYDKIIENIKNIEKEKGNQFICGLIGETIYGTPTHLSEMIIFNNFDECVYCHIILQKKYNEIKSLLKEEMIESLKSRLHTEVLENYHYGCNNISMFIEDKNKDIDYIYHKDAVKIINYYLSKK